MLISDMVLLRYTLLRALILVVVGVLLWLVWPDLSFLGLALIAVFVSGLISIFVLRRSRDNVSVSLDRRVGTIRARLREQAAAEDAWDEVRRAAEESDGQPAETEGKARSAQHEPRGE